MTTAWRMSFRIGNQGQSLWQDCLKRRVAVITYKSLHKTDLSLRPAYEPKGKWAKLAPTQSSSLAALAYKMKPKDVIYAKDGASIVGRGIVRSRYRFDPHVLARGDVDWAHHVKVDWETTYAPGLVRYVGPAQFTVHRLKDGELATLQRQIKRASLTDERATEALEGRFFTCMRSSRERNARLAQIKKSRSDYTCEICQFHFEKVYGSLGRAYIVVHHLEPIGSRKRATKTTLDDLVVVCPNCHVMLHRQKPPFSPRHLRLQIEQAKR